MFTAPTSILDKLNYFQQREVGLNHPDLYSYIRLADNGDIHIMATEGVGIILSATQRSIILVGDQVKFFTREDEGLKWNMLAFNDQATKYNEPAFIHPKENRSIYDEIEYFLGEDA